MTEVNKPLMILSVDVEALPARASDDHVNKLIWGRFDGQSSYGLRELMQEAEAYNAPLSCLLDYAEKDLYGAQIDDVARVIQSAGHDLELHLHPEILSETFWEGRGLSKPKSAPNRWGEATARVPFEYFVEEFSQVKGERPSAFRAGSFRSNLGQISAMGELGVPISSNMAHSVYVAQGRNPIGTAHDVVYTHHNGVIELPLTQLAAKDDGWVNLEYPWRGRAKDTPSEAFRKLAEEARPVVVLLLHSWVLLQRPEGGTGYFGPGQSENLHKFRSLLECAAEYFDFTSFESLAKNRLEQLARASERRLGPSEGALVADAEQRDRSRESETKTLGSVMSHLSSNEKRTYGLVIGGMRCGSTASFKNLSQHPQICPADNKEVHFFSSEENWRKGYEWYRRQWSSYDPSKHKVCLEATTHYSKYPVHKDVPKRMAEIGQELKIIYSVRDPIDRVESHLAFQLSKGYLDNKDREAFLRRAAVRYSSYFYQIEQYLRYFGKDQIFVVVQESMKETPASVFPLLFSFLGVDNNFSVASKVLNSREKYVPTGAGSSLEALSRLSDEEKEALYDALREDTEHFCKEFGVDTSRWATFNGFR